MFIGGFLIGVIVTIFVILLWLRIKDMKSGHYVFNRVKEYPKWKHLVPENPTLEEFYKVWKIEFNCDYEDCHVRTNFYGMPVHIETPYNNISHGGFVEHTETPNIDPEDFYYPDVGCPWDTDKDGIRYYKLNMRTHMPYDLDSAIAKETIMNYVKQNEGLPKNES